ncbi:putative short chain dehydrogenase [Escherichia coli]|uniref:Short chain dehydrogenase n=1 Tax=Escherichia coli TaxID=562 RepID=A0AAX2KBK0_ECOLX|nr:putative short chain dehydrogenase [Escherichia coli]
MGKAQPLPILITGGGRRIGLALAWHFINQKQPVIVSYRTHYPAIDGLIKAGAQCIQADFSTNDGVMAFADEVLKSTHGLRAILHNASAWMAEKPGTPLADVLACMMQIHVNTPYLLNHALERLLRGHGHAASDIIHFTDYVVERGSDKHVAVHVFAAYPAQPLRAGSWSCSLSLLSPSDAIAGYRPDHFYCYFPRLSGVYLDASALAGYVKTGSSGATIWRWASQ